MISQVWPQEEAQEKLKKKQSLSYSQVLQTGDTACRATWRRPGRQEGGGLDQSLHWGFHWEGPSLPRSPINTMASSMAWGAVGGAEAQWGPELTGGIGMGEHAYVSRFGMTHFSRKVDDKNQANYTHISNIRVGARFHRETVAVPWPRLEMA